MMVLCQETRNQLFAKMEDGIVLHDTDVQIIARRINNDLQIPRFNASLRWVQDFKAKEKITSRHVTRIVSRRSLQMRTTIEANSQQFVQEIRELNFPPSNIVNADQSGFLKQFISGRSLAPTGDRNVERIAQAVTSTTHSYTVLPMIFADGRLAKKLFVVLQESNGRFPARFDPTSFDNLEVHCHTSHMMTKNLMFKWIENCVATEVLNNSLLLLDDWTSWRSVNHQAIQDKLPPEKHLTIQNLPKGSTSMIQPLDVFFFRVFKGFVRRIHQHVMAHEETITFQIAQRDNILVVLQVVYHQFCHPRYQRFLQYSWQKCGYIEGYNPGREDEFDTPTKYCFPKNETTDCQHENCQNLSFVRCSYCSNSFCFNHFIVSKHFHQ